MAVSVVRPSHQITRPPLEKAPTGIRGLDEVTGGGLPRGRPTLVTGPAGSGKTLFGIEFLVRGAVDYGEPGVLLAFEERADELATNVVSLGWDLDRLQEKGLLVVDALHLDPAEVVETGAYDLEGLFIRLAYAVDAVKARRVVLDTVEILFGALKEEGIIRSELGRLFRWLKERGLTAVVTGERGDGLFTRRGIEEYVSDCVIVLDNRVQEQYSTRRLRVVKYRGSLHGTDEYPFLITDRGLEVVPITSLGLAHDAPAERLSSGIERLDYMLGGGIFRGSTMLVSGAAGTGKTTLAATFAVAACERGERVLYVSFEEAPAQVRRNMASPGLDLGRWIDGGQLSFWAVRSSALGLEGHLGALIRKVLEHGPSLVVLDAMTSLGHVGTAADVASLVIRVVDFLKSRGSTAIITALGPGESSAMLVSSIMDTWLLIRNVEANGERNRLLFVLKSRGSAHSNQVREFLITDQGIELLEVPVGPQGALVGSARLAQDAERRATMARRSAEVERRRRVLARRRAQVAAQIEVLRAELEVDSVDEERLIAEETRDQAVEDADEAAMSAHRWGDPAGATSGHEEGRDRDDR